MVVRGESRAGSSSHSSLSLWVRGGECVCVCVGVTLCNCVGNVGDRQRD